MTPENQTNEFNKTIQNLIKNQKSILMDKIKAEAGKMGIDESRFINIKMARIMVLTWNVGGFKPPTYKEIASLFEKIPEDKPDIIVVGKTG